MSSEKNFDILKLWFVLRGGDIVDSLDFKDAIFHSGNDLWKRCQELSEKHGVSLQDIEMKWSFGGVIVYGLGNEPFSKCGRCGRDIESDDWSYCPYCKQSFTDW